jgi:hypothetical protein
LEEIPLLFCVRLGYTNISYTYPFSDCLLWLTSDFKTSLRANSWPFCQEVLGEAKRKNCNCLRALARVSAKVAPDGLNRDTSCYNFTGASLELLKMGKPARKEVLKWLLLKHKRLQDKTPGKRDCKAK